ncbi:MAG: hypothetical protein WAO41_09770 [Candidatus Nanopelagicales bacterium]
MSNTYHETAKALAENDELRDKVMAAGSAEERAAVLRDAGVPVPTHADINAAHAEANMAGVDGGNTTTSVIKAAAPAAAEAAAAA